MLNTLFKGIVDFLYMVRLAKSKFRKQNPDEAILAADGAKAICTNAEVGVERRLEWAASRRSVVMLTDKRIKCGNWNIPLDEITSATVVQFLSFFGQGQVVKIETVHGKHYQFGMQRNQEWTNQNVLPVTIENVGILTSSGILIRLAAVGYLLYLALKDFFI